MKRGRCIKILPTLKGNATVILDKEYYNTKINALDNH